MVIYVAVRKKNYQNVTNCYIINLAIADLLFLSLSIPYTLYLDIMNSYPFGDTFCKIYTYLAYVSESQGTEVTALSMIIAGYSPGYLQ